MNCFKWAVLSAMFPVKKNSDRLSSYRQHENSIDFKGLQFSMQPCQIPVFEHNNPSIAIHVLVYDEENEPFPCCTCRPKCIGTISHHAAVARFAQRLGSGDHYVWVKSLSHLMASKYSHEHVCHICLSCLQPFTLKRVLDVHEPHCLMLAPQQCIYPIGKRAKLSFVKHGFKFLYYFFVMVTSNVFSCHMRIHQSTACTFRRDFAFIA